MLGALERVSDMAMKWLRNACDKENAFKTFIYKKFEEVGVVRWIGEMERWVGV